MHASRAFLTLVVLPALMFFSADVDAADADAADAILAMRGTVQSPAERPEEGWGKEEER